MEEGSGICGDEAYAVRRGIGARDGLFAGVTDCEHRARAVGTSAKRCEDVPGLAVDANTFDTLEAVGNLDTLEARPPVRRGSG